MPASAALLGYGSILGRRGSTLTTIAAAITANAAPQVVTPASMTSIVVGSVLAIDTANAALTEPVVVTVVTGTTFTAIFNNTHGTNINIALQIPVLEIVKMGGPAVKADMKEVSNMLSPGGYKEFIAGLRDGGQLTFEGNYIPKDATQTTQRTDLDGGVLSNWTLALPTTGSGPPVAGNGIWAFIGYVESLTPAVPLDDRITVTGAIKVTGKPVLF